MKKPLVLIVVSCLLILLVGGGLLLAARARQGATAPQSGSQAKNSATVKQITSSELYAMLPNKSFYLVNVHVPYAGEIAKTDAFIPYDKITSAQSQLPKDKNAQIVLYCRSGRMSRIAAQKAVSAGYTNIYELAGGMEAWQAAGYEILQQPGR